MALRITILPTWDDHLEESFCYTVAHFERFNPRVKTSYYHPAENINETPSVHAVCFVRMKGGS